MPAHQTEWTADMLRALPDDGKRYEVLDRELFVSPAPSALHQRAVFLLSTIPPLTIDVVKYFADVWR